MSKAVEHAWREINRQNTHDAKSGQQIEHFVADAQVYAALRLAIDQRPENLTGGLVDHEGLVHRIVARPA